jgi:hypothetical protein
MHELNWAAKSFQEQSIFLLLIATTTMRNQEPTGNPNALPCGFPNASSPWFGEGGEVGEAAAREHSSELRPPL